MVIKANNSSKMSRRGEHVRKIESPVTKKQFHENDDDIKNIKTYKDDHWEEGEDMPQPAHVLSSWSRVPSHLFFWWFFAVCFYRSQSANFVHWFSDKCHRKSMTLWYFNVSQFHIIYRECIVLSRVINNSDFSSPLFCKTETKYLM